MKVKSTINISGFTELCACFVAEEKLAYSWHMKGRNTTSIWDRHHRQKAAIAFDDCQEEGLNRSESLMTRAKALSDKGRYEEAAAAYDSAIEATPRHFTIDIAIASAEKGKALEKAGRHSQALKAFKRALELSPEDIETWHYKGLALRSLGHRSEVHMALAMVCELSH